MSASESEGRCSPTAIALTSFSDEHRAVASSPACLGTRKLCQPVMIGGRHDPRPRSLDGAGNADGHATAFRRCGRLGEVCRTSLAHLAEELVGGDGDVDRVAPLARSRPRGRTARAGVRGTDISDQWRRLASRRAAPGGGHRGAVGTGGHQQPGGEQQDEALGDRHPGPSGDLQSPRPGRRRRRALPAPAAAVRRRVVSSRVMRRRRGRGGHLLFGPTVENFCFRL